MTTPKQAYQLAQVFAAKSAVISYELRNLENRLNGPWQTNKQGDVDYAVCQEKVNALTDRHQMLLTLEADITRILGLSDEVSE